MADNAITQNKAAQYQRLKDEIARLTDAIWEYGEHRKSCRIDSGKECDCGFFEIIKSLPAEEADGLAVCVTLEVITKAQIDAATQAIVERTFAPHELPLDDRLAGIYRGNAYAALRAARDAVPHLEGRPSTDGRSGGASCE